MNCHDIAENIFFIADASLPKTKLEACMQHVQACRECQDALEGTRALRNLRAHATETAPAGLFEAVLENVSAEPAQPRVNTRFWSGAGFGGAIAAALLAAAFALGVFVTPGNQEPVTVQFAIAHEEVRPMHVAIETEQALAGAQITVMLSGGVAIDGFENRRELTWSDDLDAGVNKLTLPLYAIGDAGGQVVVRLSHPDSEQIFVVDLNLES